MTAILWILALLALASCTVTGHFNDRFNDPHLCVRSIVAILALLVSALHMKCLAVLTIVLTICLARKVYSSNSNITGLDLTCKAPDCFNDRFNDLLCTRPDKTIYGFQYCCPRPRI